MNNILAIIYLYAMQYNIDPDIVKAVVAVESNFNVNAVGSVGELSLMQLNPTSFPGYTKEQLKNPYLNIKLGVEYLSKLKQSCVHKDNDTYLVCYNLGSYKATKVKHPKLWPYYKKVKKKYLEFKAQRMYASVEE